MAMSIPKPPLGKPKSGTGATGPTKASVIAAGGKVPKAVKVKPEIDPKTGKPIVAKK